MEGLCALVNSKDFIRNIRASRTGSSEKTKRTPKYYHKNNVRRPVLLDKTDSSSNAPTNPATTFGELLKLDKTFGKLEKIILKQEDQPAVTFQDNFQPASPSDNFEVKECIIGEAFVLSSGYESVEYLPAVAPPRQLSNSNRRMQHPRRNWTFKKHAAAKAQVHEFTFYEGGSWLSHADNPTTTAKKNTRLLPEAPPTDLQSTQKKNKENYYHIEFPPVQTAQMSRKITHQKQQTVSSKSSSQTTHKNYEVDVLNYDSRQSSKDDLLIESIKFKPIITVLKDQHVLTRHQKPADKPVFDVKPIKPAGIQVEMIKLTIDSPSDVPALAPGNFSKPTKHPQHTSQRRTNDWALAASSWQEQKQPDLFEPAKAISRPHPELLTNLQPPVLRGPQLLDDQPHPRFEEPSDEDLNDALHKHASGKSGSIRFKSHFRSSSYHSSLRKSSVSPPRYVADHVGQQQSCRKLEARLVFSAKFLTYVSSRIYCRSVCRSSWLRG